AAVEGFHHRLDAEDYESIYENTTDSFRASASHADLVRVFETAHQKLGNSGSTTQIGLNVNWQNGHQVVTQVLITQYAKGSVKEGFIWIVTGDQDEPFLH